jgi:hypothetical protein
MDVASASDVLSPAYQATFVENLTDGLNALCQPDSWGKLHQSLAAVQSCIRTLPSENNSRTWL